MTDLELLEIAAAEIEWTLGGLPFGKRYAVFRSAGTLSLTSKGFLAISHLSRSLQLNRPALRRGCKFESLRKVVADRVIRLFESRLEEGPNPSRQDLVQLKRTVGYWFAKRSANRTHIVPCAVIPGPARSFDVGPVRFMHAADFDAADLGVKGHAGFEAAWATIERQLQEQAASWVAVVEVTDCERARGEEIADAVVDIALGALQAILGAHDARFMSRTTARANPPYRGSVAVSSNEINAGLRNMEAGRLLLPETLLSIIGSAEELMRSFGRRISAFLSIGSDLQALEQAWCDGTYWFHEGLAEPLDTVAVAKLETAMENLLAAGSTVGSRERIRTALRLMVSGESDEDAEREQVEFARRVVEARSKVLHGTRSTTRDDPGVDRRPVEVVVQRMLATYSLLLDSYSNEDAGQDKDNVRSFLGWIERGRAKS